MDKHAILCILISLWVVDILLCIVLYVGTKEVLMSDTDATQARQDVVADVDEILENVINANTLSMPYDVYCELFDAVAGLGVKVEKLQAENAKLMESCKKWMGKAAHYEAVAIRLRELLDYALPIAMYAASIEEGDRMRELMREIGE